MSGFVTAAVTMYSADQANQRADAQASNQNANNLAANEASVANANANNKARKGELLRRFNISTDKLKDNSQELFQSQGFKLSAVNSQLIKAQSASDNALATNHITGRLAERMRNASSIQGSISKSNIIQQTESELKTLGDKLETMAMNKESDDMNLDIDTTNAINSANNSLISNHAYSQSTGMGGVVATGLSSGISAYSQTKG